MQGGTAQGIGWALNEEYVYDEQERWRNAGFLDYRMPVPANDLPMIDPVIIEVPNLLSHPLGHPRRRRSLRSSRRRRRSPTRDHRAVGVRGSNRELPMSPPHVLAELKKVAR